MQNFVEDGRIEHLQTVGGNAASVRSGPREAVMSNTRQRQNGTQQEFGDYLYHLSRNKAFIRSTIKARLQGWGKASFMPQGRAGRNARHRRGRGFWVGQMDIEQGLVRAAKKTRKFNAIWLYYVSCTYSPDVSRTDHIKQGRGKRFSTLNVVMYITLYHWKIITTSSPSSLSLSYRDRLLRTSG